VLLESYKLPFGNGCLASRWRCFNFIYKMIDQHSGGRGAALG